jgi:hypothetical protein
LVEVAVTGASLVGVALVGSGSGGMARSMGVGGARVWRRVGRRWRGVVENKSEVKIVGSAPAP